MNIFRNALLLIFLSCGATVAIANDDAAWTHQGQEGPTWLTPDGTIIAADDSIEQPRIHTTSDTQETYVAPANVDEWSYSHTNKLAEPDYETFVLLEEGRHVYTYERNGEVWRATVIVTPNKASYSDRHCSVPFSF